MAFKIPLGNLLVRLTGDSTSFNKMLDSAQRKMDSVSKKMSAVGKKLTVAVTLPLAALGAASVKAFSDFDDAMTKSLAIMGNVSAELRKEMEDTANTISRNSVTSATDLAEAYFFLASAGLDAKQSIAALPAVEKFAVAGAFDMATATDLLTDAQTALGLSVKDPQKNLANMVQLSDTLVKANTLANASVEQFSKALVTKAAASLRALNKPLAEGVAVLAAFADAGIKGELAGEKLSIVLRDLQSASEKNTGAWKKLGLSVFDANQKMLPLADIIGQLEKKFGGMTDQQKKSAATMLGFQDRSFSAIRVLLGTSDKIREFQKRLGEAGGITEEVARKQLLSFASQMIMVKNKIVEVARSIGKILAPALTWLGKQIGKVTEWWRGLSLTSKRWVIGIAAAVAAIGPLLLGLSGMISAFVWIAGALGTLTLASVGWTFALLLVAGAAVLVTDMILQMTDTANLGILDMVNDFRIGGSKIATWMQATWLLIFQGWSWLQEKLEIGWHSYLAATQVNVARATNIFLKGLLLMSNAWERYKNFVTFGVFSNLFKANIEENTKFFNKKIAESALAGVGLLTKTASKITSVSREAAAEQARFDKSITSVFAKDEMDKNAERNREAMRKAGLPDTLKIPGLPKQPDLPNVGEQVKQAAQAQKFEVINLRRFALEGKGGLSGAPKKAQEVKAPTLEERLDTLIEQGNQKTVAVLG